MILIIVYLSWKLCLRGLAAFWGADLSTLILGILLEAMEFGSECPIEKFGVWIDFNEHVFSPYAKSTWNCGTFQ